MIYTLLNNPFTTTVFVVAILLSCFCFLLAYLLNRARWPEAGQPNVGDE